MWGRLRHCALLRSIHCIPLSIRLIARASEPYAKESLYIDLDAAHPFQGSRIGQGVGLPDQQYGVAAVNYRTLLTENTY